VLVTLRLVLADGTERLLSRELEADEATRDPREILELTSSEGRVALSDRESCSLESVAKVEVVHPEPRKGPTLEGGIRDEDVAAALEGNYNPP
jgi:hypothetical protein